MKHLYIVLLSLFSFSAFAQPVIEGTYLPVKGTRILQVYDTTAVQLFLPTTGANQVWDYSSAFVNLTDTFELATFDPSATPYASTFPTATHASYLRVPWNSFADSLYSYFRVDTIGMHGVGAWSEKQEFDTSFITMPEELVMLNEVTYGTTLQDTAISTGFATYGGFEVKWIQHNYKHMEGIGYGTLATPDGSYGDVLLGVEEITKIDSFFVDVLGTGNYTFSAALPIPGGNPRVRMTEKYHFLRNNTFASTHLMLLEGDTAGNLFYGWYTLPVDVCSISGHVYDTTGIGVTDGKVLLYREHSNFTKNDILAKVDIQPDGSYQFDSIPYGEYRIAARADQSIYTRSFKTYYGDTTDWVNCETVVTANDTSGIDINIIYRPAPGGAGNIGGRCRWNTNLKNNDPIPGIDIIVEKDPEDEPITTIETDQFGNFEFPDLADGDYRLWVDIPGLHMAGTYSFTIAGGTTLANLDFEAGMDSIFPTSTVSVEHIEMSAGHVTAYPNPFENEITISVEPNMSSAVSIDIFDITGRLITSPVTEKMVYAREEFSVTELESNGVYLARIQIGTEIQTIQIIKK